MRYLFIITLFAFSLFSAEVADISFSGGSVTWTTYQSATLSSGTLTLPGSKTANQYPRADATIWWLANAESIENLYFVADLWMTDIDEGDLAWHRPKLKINNASSGAVLSALNLEDLVQEKWYTHGMVITNFKSRNVNAITLEFGLQSCEGTFKIRNPKLLDAPPSSNYSFPFTTPANPQCNVELITNSLKPFPKNLLSINCHFLWSSGSWGDSEVRSILKEKLPLGNLRFPGGTVGNFYDWQSDGFHGDAITQNYNTTCWNGYQDGFRFGFDDYASLCVESGATSTLMFNVIQDNVSTAADRLRDRIDNYEITIDWIEMGNENFFINQALGNVATTNLVPDVNKYISHTTALSSALKGVDPAVKTAVGIRHDDWTSGSWNDIMSKQSYYDACVLHPYINTRSFMLNEYSAKMMLSAYATTRTRLDEYKRLFPNTPLVCSEWSILSGNGTPPNFIQSLGVADMFFALLEGNESGIVQQMGLHMFQLSDEYKEGTCYFHDGSVMKRTLLGVVYEMLVSFFTGGKLFDAVGTSTDLETGIPGMLARAVQKGDSTQILVVNKLPVEGSLTATMDGSTINSAYTMEWFTADILNDKSGYPLTQDPLQTSSGSGSPMIPAYSVAVVTFQNATEIAQSVTGHKNAGIYFRQMKNGLFCKIDKVGTVRLTTLTGRTVEMHSTFESGVLGKTLSRGMYLLQYQTKDLKGRRKVIIK